MEEDFERYSNNNAAGVLQVLPEPQRSLLHWLLDLLIETAKYEHVNNMSAKDLGRCAVECELELFCLSFHEISSPCHSFF